MDSPPLRRGYAARMSRWKTFAKIPVEYSHLLGKGPFAVYGHLLINPDNQMIERISVIRRLAVEMHIHRIGMRLGVRSTGRGCAGGSCRNPGRFV